MEQCKNPKQCKIKHERWKKNQERFIPIGEKEHELFLKKIEDKDYKADSTKHASIRDFQRVVTENDINEVTLYGWVIERNINYETQNPRILIMGYTSSQRPLHLVYEIHIANYWTLITVYSPLSKREKWNESFTERVCFCE